MKCGKCCVDTGTSALAVPMNKPFKCDRCGKKYFYLPAKMLVREGMELGNSMERVDVQWK